LFSLAISANTADIWNSTARGGSRLGWGARIRTWGWRNQNPLPYHLATPQKKANCYVFVVPRGYNVVLWGLQGLTKWE
jgi:hypothetical protein